MPGHLPTGIGPKIGGAVAGDPKPLDGAEPLLGTNGAVRLAAVTLVVPLHALLRLGANYTSLN